MDYTLIAIATIIQFIVGALWYSPLMFGKFWMEIMDCTNLSPEELKAMQKSMMPFYGLQFFLTLFTTFNLVNFSILLPFFSIYHIAVWIWAGFIMPTQIGCVVWGNTEKKYWMKQILVMISYSLVGLLLASWILSM